MNTRLHRCRMRPDREHLLLSTLKRLVRLLGLLAFRPVVAGAQNIKEDLSPLRLEHVRLNVADAAATARCSAEYADSEIRPAAPAGVVYVVDIHKLNGQVVNCATKLPHREGLIGLQSETAEIYYRNNRIKEFADIVPAEQFLKN